MSEALVLIIAATIAIPMMGIVANAGHNDKWAGIWAVVTIVWWFALVIGLHYAIY